ncbi:2-phospho-L-lactate guanylyltransferase [Parafrankia discariae]|uniref:2-phospho-L-lactate guanylyltransferase n=1 Tax=Parafrankia discariae TaxID=365528 RepID=UPI00035F679E|nr:2-phospho-L-lactate guanylyltransferase [Parafrankia discariae]
MPTTETAPSWVVLVPLKPLTVAKSRLDRPDRGALALAMALDTAGAVLDVGGGVVRLVVVTDDHRARRALTELAQSRSAVLAGAAVVGQSGRLLVAADEPGRGLNPALAHGAALARRIHPGCAVAAVSADLPALRPAELRQALAAAPPSGRGVLADAVGTGTVLLSAAPGSPLCPSFGPGSFQAHLDSGAVDLTARLADTVPGLRRDVDTVADLTAARALGLGPATARALAADPSPRSAA